MEDAIVAVIKYECEFILSTVSSSRNLNGLFDDIVRKWPFMNQREWCIRYALDGYGNCTVEKDEDLKLMTTMCAVRKLLHVDMEMSPKSVDCVEGDELIDDSLTCCIFDEFDMMLNNSSVADRFVNYSSWSSLIREVGQIFDGGVSQFRSALTRFCIAVGFNFVYKKNERGRITAVCFYKELKGCPWRIHASRGRINEFFYIRKFVNIHTCGDVLRKSSHPRVTSELVGKLLEDKVRRKPLYRPIDAIDEIKQNYGLDIKYHHAWLGVENARRSVFGDASTSFAMLESYFEYAMRSNPGSLLLLEEDARRFERCFISFAPCCSGFTHIRPMIFLDGTFLKGQTNAVILAANCKDGNQEIYHLAFAVVTAENNDNWSWFLKNLRSVLDSDRPIVFVSDRHSGIIDGVRDVFPDSYHVFCLYHIEMNLRAHLKGFGPAIKEKLVSMLKACAFAPNVEKFLISYNALVSEGGQRVADFLGDIPSENWCCAHFKGQRYGEMYNNVAESWNHKISEARHLPITKLIDTIRIQTMESIAKKRRKCMSWNGVLCPVMQSRLQTVLDKGRTWNISSSSDRIFEVHCDLPVFVDTEARFCSCGEWKHVGFPCAHAAAVIVKNSQYTGKGIMDYVDRYFFRDCYEKSYGMCINPVVVDSNLVVAERSSPLLPPITRRLPGRPKKKRIPSKGEKPRKLMRCGRCKMLGTHNRKTCKAIV